jgi:DNA anti-recombination protein RmuC
MGQCVKSRIQELETINSDLSEQLFKMQETNNEAEQKFIVTKTQMESEKLSLEESLKEVKLTSEQSLRNVQEDNMQKVIHITKSIRNRLLFYSDFLT